MTKASQKLFGFIKRRMPKMYFIRVKEMHER